MPNWSRNTLIVVGRPEDVEAFIKRAEGPSHKYVGPFNKGFSGSIFSKSEEITSDQVEGLRGEIRRLMDMPDSFFTEEAVCGFSFHSLFPVPKHVLLRPYSHVITGKEQENLINVIFEDYPATDGGFGWEVENWGVKWGNVEREEWRDSPSCWFEVSLEDYRDSRGFLAGFDTEEEGFNSICLGGIDVPIDSMRIVQFNFTTASDIPYNFLSKIAADWPHLYFYIEAEIEGSEWDAEYAIYFDGKFQDTDAYPYEEEHYDDEE